MASKVYPLKKCPWCNKTPKFYMLYDDLTWLPYIYCDNYYCNVQPKSKYVPIRKKQKQNPIIIQEKIEMVINKWNDNLETFWDEGIELDYDAISKES